MGPTSLFFSLSHCSRLAYDIYTILHGVKNELGEFAEDCYACSQITDRMARCAEDIPMDESDKTVLNSLLKGCAEFFQDRLKDMPAPHMSWRHAQEGILALQQLEAMSRLKLFQVKFYQGDNNRISLYRKTTQRFNERFASFGVLERHNALQLQQDKATHASRPSEILIANPPQSLDLWGSLAQCARHAWDIHTVLQDIRDEELAAFSEECHELSRCTNNLARIIGNVSRSETQKEALHSLARDCHEFLQNRLEDLPSPLIKSEKDCPDLDSFQMERLLAQSKMKMFFIRFHNSEHSRVWLYRKIVKGSDERFRGFEVRRRVFENGQVMTFLKDSMMGNGETDSPSTMQDEVEECGVDECSLCSPRSD